MSSHNHAQQNSSPNAVTREVRLKPKAIILASLAAFVLTIMMFVSLFVHSYYLSGRIQF